MYFLEHIFIIKISRKKLAENLLRSGSGSGRFQKKDPYPVKNLPDPQYCPQHLILSCKWLHGVIALESFFGRTKNVYDMIALKSFLDSMKNVYHLGHFIFVFRVCNCAKRLCRYLRRICAIFFRTGDSANSQSDPNSGNWFRLLLTLSLR
jgi:hypothetical protein